MKTLRYCVLAFVFVSVGLGYWALVRQDAQANMQDAQQADRNCNCMQKHVIPQDPKERAEFDKAAFQRIADEQAEQMRRNALERLKWVGCKVVCSAKPGDEDFER